MEAGRRGRASPESEVASVSCSPTWNPYSRSLSPISEQRSFVPLIIFGTPQASDVNTDVVPADTQSCVQETQANSMCAGISGRVVNLSQGRRVGFRLLPGVNRPPAPVAAWPRFAAGLQLPSVTGTVLAAWCTVATHTNAHSPFAYGVSAARIDCPVRTNAVGAATRWLSGGLNRWPAESPPSTLARSRRKATPCAGQEIVPVHQLVPGRSARWWCIR